MKKQLWFIGGGEVHESREDFLHFLKNYPYEMDGPYSDWKSWMRSGLADEYQSIKPDFPNRQNADYDAWKIWFEKYIEQYIVSPAREEERSPKDTEEFSYGGSPKITIIAHSLGGIFIAKYLSENIFPVRINSLHMVAGVFDNE